MLVKQSSTQHKLPFLMVLTSDHITGATGLSPTVTISKNGASFASPTGAVTEIGSGWYVIAGNATDSATLGPLLLHATSATADPTDREFEVVAFDPQVALATQSTITTLQADTDDIQTRLPAALSGGNMKCDVLGISGDTTAADNLETMLDGTGGQILSLRQLNVVNSSGDAIVATAGTSGSGIKATGAGALHGLLVDGGSGGGDGLRANGAGGGKDIRAVITGDLIGSVSGSVGSVTGAVGSVTAMVTANAIQLSGDTTAADNAEAFFDGTGYAGTNNVIPTVTTVGTLTTYTGNTPQTGDVFPLASTEIADIKAKTDLIPAAPASTTNITAGTITTVTNLTNAPTAGDLTATMKTSVNAEVLDVLNVDTFAEPGQETPAATNTIQKKIGYLFKFLRNRATQTATTQKIYADDATTVDQKSTVSDDTVTFDRGEFITGP